VCADLHENKHDIEQKLGSERIDKGGKVGKGADAKTKKSEKSERKNAKPDGTITNIDIPPFIEQNPTLYSKDIKYNQTLLDDLQHNNTSEYVWIYNDEVELLVKVNLRIISTL